MYKRWRVYSTFLTGLCIGLAYALLIGGPQALGLSDTDLLVEWKVLVLAFSGVLGGVIYTIVIDGEVEMPRFITDQGALFKAGLFGDILLGMSGAFILELLLPISLSVMEGDTSGTAVAATGIIGGYGGRAIIKFSLERFFKYTGTLDEVRAAAMRGQLESSNMQSQRDGDFSGTASPSDDSSSAETSASELPAEEHVLTLIDQADRYIQGKLSTSEWVQFTQQLQAEPPSVQRAVSAALADLREEVADELSTEQLQRMVVLFESFIGLSPNNHQLYHQLALLNKDLSPPVYERVLIALDKAIALRGPLSISQSSAMEQPWQYELLRAVVNIEQGQAATEDFTMTDITQEAILADLLAIEEVYNIEPILKAADKRQIPKPVVNWIRYNQELLSEREETRSLMNSLRSIVVEERFRPIGSASSDTTPQATETQQSTGFPKIFSALGRCYDILYLDPFNILADQSAKATQVFDFDPKEARRELDEDKEIPIPKGTRYTPGSSGRMQVSEQTNLLYTESDVQKMFAGTLGATLTQLLGAILPFSLSASYATYKSERATQKSVYAFTKAEYVHYTLEIDEQQPAALHLNETFRQAVNQLPLTATLDYLTFIDRFGTHTATQVQFGGLFHHRYRLKQSSYAAVLESGGNVSIEAKRAFEAKYENKNQGSKFQEFSDRFENFDICGGIKKENIYDWFSTIKGDPAPIHLELMPLYELLDSTFFPEDEQIIKKRLLLTTATQKYLEENSEIPWEPWVSAAVGGNGGTDFLDIDPTPAWLAANQERYQYARVKEVRVWIKDWVEGVQMVLEGDMQPLKVHGDEEGEELVLSLEADDYITAVYVMPGSKKFIRDRGPYVGFIKVQTHKGEVLSVGTPDSRAISLDIPDGYQAIGFHGRCDKRIDKLGVISIPVIEKN